MARSHTIAYLTSDMTPRTAHLTTVDWQDNPFGPPGAAFALTGADRSHSPWVVYNPQDGTTVYADVIAIPAAGGTAKFIRIEPQAFEADPGQGQPNRRITFKFKIYNVDGSDEREDSEVYFIDPDPNSHHTSDPNNPTHYRVTIPDSISFPGEPDFQID